MDPRQSHVNSVLALGEARLERIPGADGCITRSTVSKKREEEDELELNLTRIVAFVENS